MSETPTPPPAPTNWADRAAAMAESAAGPRVMRSLVPRRVLGVILFPLRMIDWAWYAGAWAFEWDDAKAAPRERPNSLLWRFDVALAMWRARYWYDRDWEMPEVKP